MFTHWLQNYSPSVFFRIGCFLCIFLHLPLMWCVCGVYICVFPCSLPCWTAIHNSGSTLSGKSVDFLVIPLKVIRIIPQLLYQRELDEGAFFLSGVDGHCKLLSSPFLRKWWPHHNLHRLKTFTLSCINSLSFLCVKFFLLSDFLNMYTKKNVCCTFDSIKLHGFCLTVSKKKTPFIKKKC